MSPNLSYSTLSLCFQFTLSTCFFILSSEITQNGFTETSVGSTKSCGYYPSLGRLFILMFVFFCSWCFHKIDTASKLICIQGTWCTTIAKRTFLLQHGGRPVNSPSSWQPQTYTSLLRSIATSAYRFVMVCTSVVVGFALGRVPLVGWIAEFGFLCWVDA